MAKIAISLVEKTAFLEDPFRAAFKGHDLLFLTANRSIPLRKDGSPDPDNSKSAVANRWPADLYISVPEGGNPDGDGMIVKYAGKETGKSYAVCLRVYNNLIALNPPEENGISNGDALGEVYGTDMLSVYVKAGNFDDGEIDAWAHDKAEAIARAIADGCAKFLDSVAAPAEPNVPDPDAPSTPDTPAETDTEEWPQPITGDAALGYAIRTVFAAFWEAQNGRD